MPSSVCTLNTGLYQKLLRALPRYQIWYWHGKWSYAGFWPATASHEYGSESGPSPYQPCMMRSAASCVSGSPRNVVMGSTSGSAGRTASFPRQLFLCNMHRAKSWN